MKSPATVQIRNYTSSVPVATTVSWIEQRLAAAGARDILKSYDPVTRELVALKFILALDSKQVAILLPAKVAACAKELQAAVK